MSDERTETGAAIPPEHTNECMECRKTFDMRDLTQVMFHMRHGPVPVLDVPPGERIALCGCGHPLRDHYARWDGVAERGRCPRCQCISGLAAPTPVERCPRHGAPFCGGNSGGYECGCDRAPSPETTPRDPRDPGDEAMINPDPFLIHELLHGASLAMELLDRVGGGEVYAPVWEAHPEARRAYDAAMDALYDFYQAMGRISAPLPDTPEDGDAKRALRNVRMLVVRHKVLRESEWAGFLLRFCEEGGAMGSPLRAEGA